MREQVQILTEWVYGVWVDRLFLVGLLVAGAFMGLGSAWDFHWHEVIGRDSFWIPPHMLIYSGTLLATTLVFLIGLRTSAEVRSANPLVVLRALDSQGYGVVGIGGLTMAVAAGFDEFWHRTIGDLTIWSPPHVMGVIGGVIIGLGTIIALLHASRRHLLPRRWGRIGVLGIVASVLVSAYFGLIPGAVMAFTPQRATYRFFTTNNPYFVAVIATITIPVIVTGAQRVLGRRGFEFAAVVGVGLWCLQEAFHEVATPVVAGVFGYVVKHPYGILNLRFDLLVLGFMLLPPLVASRLAATQPWMAGSLLGVLYTAEVAIWLSIVGLTQSLSVPAVLVLITVGAISARFGTSCGQWIRRVSALSARRALEPAHGS